MHQYPHASRHLRGFHHGYPGAVAGLHQRCRLVQRQSGRAWHDALGAADHGFGVGAGERVRHDTHRITQCDPGDAFPQLVHHANAITPQCLGQLGIEVGLQQTGAQLGVERCHTGRLQLDPHLARARLRQRQLCKPHYIRRPVAVELNGEHAIFQRAGCCLPAPLAAGSLAGVARFFDGAPGAHRAAATAWPNAALAPANPCDTTSMSLASTTMP